MGNVVIPMSAHNWASFVVVALVVSLVPGPAFLIVLSTALRGGFRASLFANAGVLVGDVTYFSLTALGLGSLLVTSHLAFIIVKWLGVAYLAYLGICSLLSREFNSLSPDQQVGAGLRAFTRAITIQLANPKLLLFLVALVPQFIEPGRSIAGQFAILGGTFVLSDAIVYLLVGAFAARTRRLLTTPRAVRFTNRITGLAMLGAAARIAADR